MASVTQWTWVWANSRRYWRTGKPGVLQPMGSQRVRHNLATEQQKGLPLDLSPAIVCEGLHTSKRTDLQKFFLVVMSEESSLWSSSHGTQLMSKAVTWTEIKDGSTSPQNRESASSWWNHLPNSIFKLVVFSLLSTFKQSKMCHCYYDCSRKWEFIYISEATYVLVVVIWASLVAQIVKCLLAKRWWFSC